MRGPQDKDPVQVGDVSGVCVSLPLCLYQRVSLLSRLSFHLSVYLQLLCSLYVKKKQYFEQERIAGASKAERRAELARDLLGAATRVREAATDESYKSLVTKRTNGKIAPSTTDPILRKTAECEAWLAQSNHLLHRGVSTSQYLELEGAISAIERQNGGSTMTPGYGNLSEDRAAVQRSWNTRINDLPPRDERRGIDASWESLRLSGGSKYPPFDLFGTPEWIRRDRKVKIGRVTTLTTQKMIDPSVPRSERNKAFVVHDRLATGNPAFVSTVVNLMPTLPGTQDLLEACMTQVSLENSNRTK